MAQTSAAISVADTDRYLSLVRADSANYVLEKARMAPELKVSNLPTVLRDHETDWFNLSGKGRRYKEGLEL